MIKNIIFDIGNVILKWKPSDVVSKVFPDRHNPIQLSKSIFKNQIWLDLNLGKLTIDEAIEEYNKELGIDKSALTVLMREIKESLTPLEGSLELVDKLKDKYPLYCITDNVKEFMVMFKEKYDFLDKFEDVIVSADIGILKPSPEIYLHLLNKHNLIPNETLFLDDHLPNVEGAINVGMHAIHFTTPGECEAILAEDYNIFI